MNPTLAEFQQYVADHQVRYFIAGGNGGPGGRSGSTAADIATWVQQHFAPVNLGGTTVYDLFAPRA